MFKPVLQCHNCPLRLDPNPNILKHFKKYFCKINDTGKDLFHGGKAGLQWMNRNVLKKSNTKV